MLLSNLILVIFQNGFFHHSGYYGELKTCNFLMQKDLTTLVSVYFPCEGEIYWLQSYFYFCTHCSHVDLSCVKKDQGAYKHTKKSIIWHSHYNDVSWKRTRFVKKIWRIQFKLVTNDLNLIACISFLNLLIDSSKILWCFYGNT